MDLAIGMIGVGGLGYLQAKSFRKIEGVRVVAAADVAEDARALFEREFQAPAYEHYRQLFHEHVEELDAVAIVTPHTLHHEQAKAAIRHGLNVLIEKPMVTDVRHAIDLVETAEQQDVVLQVGYQRHFHPGFRELRRLIAEGRIGQLHTVNCYLGQAWIDHHRDSWRTDPSLSGGGQLYDTGSHLLDALLWTTDAEPRTAASQITYDTQDVDVNSAMSLELEREGTTLVASVGLSGNGMEVEPHEGYVYWGTDGRITYEDGEITVTEADAMTYTTEVSEGMDFETLNRRKIENFSASIEGSADPAVPGEVGVRVTALTEAIYRAEETDAAVQVDPILEGARNDLD